MQDEQIKREPPSSPGVHVVDVERVRRALEEIRRRAEADDPAASLVAQLLSAYTTLNAEVEQLRALVAASSVPSAGAEDDRNRSFTHTEPGEVPASSSGLNVNRMNETTRLFDEERRRWYRALRWAGHLEGLAPEVAAERVRDSVAELTLASSASSTEPQDLLGECVPRVLEPLREAGITEPDALKHTLEDHARWRASASSTEGLVCPHCALPPVLPDVCTPELHAVIEKNIARDWDLFNAGRDHRRASSTEG